MFGYLIYLLRIALEQWNIYDWFDLKIKDSNFINYPMPITHFVKSAYAHFPHIFAISRWLLNFCFDGKSKQNRKNRKHFSIWSKSWKFFKIPRENMVAPFPLVKLGVLVIKQISKPLANSIASRAKKSPFFRNYFCIPTANFFHWADVKVRMRILNLGKVSKVPKLDEKKAIDTGAQVSESSFQRQSM